MAAMVPGCIIKVKGPEGKMVYTPNMVREIGMLAGGTGITPMLQIIRAVLRNPEDRTKITLIYANITPADILLREDLENLTIQYPEKFKLHLVVEKASQGTWNGDIGYITDQIIQKNCPPPAKDIKILICGPPPMVTAMKMHTEVFSLLKSLITRPSVTKSLGQSVNSKTKSSLSRPYRSRNCRVLHYCIYEP